MNTARMNCFGGKQPAMVSRWAVVLLLAVVASPVSSQDPDSQAPRVLIRLKPGDAIELPGGYKGTVISVDGENVSLLLSVPIKELAVAGSTSPSSPRTGNSGAIEPRPRSPRVSQPAYVATWLSTDRAIVIKDRSRFRVFWTDESGTVNVDDGTYQLRNNFDGGRTFDFTSAEGVTWPWRLDSVDATSLVMSHEEAGTRVFRRVDRKDDDAVAGNWDVNYTTDQGSTGTATVHLFKDGMYVIDEYDRFGRFDHREYGSWKTQRDSRALTITFPFRGQLQTVTGSLRVVDKDNMVWNFTSLGGVGYTYRCRRAE